MIRIRFTYQKIDALRYISHLDLQKMWIRIVLRAKVPLAYTNGFHPVPKMAVAWPLPLGWDGMNELVDFWFDYPEDTADDPRMTEALIQQLDAQSPAGLHIFQAQRLPIYDPALTTLIQSADYTIRLNRAFDLAELQAKIQRVLDQPSIERVRRNRRYDLRALVEALMLDTAAGNHSTIQTRMAARDSAMGRPDELVDELGINQEDVSYSRDRFLLTAAPAKK